MPTTRTNLRRSLLFVLGLTTILAPRRMLAIQARINTVGFDGTDGLTPQDWLVTLTRIAGVAVVTIAVLTTDASGDPTRTDDGDSPDTDV